MTIFTCKEVSINDKVNLYLSCFHDFHIKLSREDITHAFELREQAPDYIEYYITEKEDLIGGIIGYALDAYRNRADMFLPQGAIDEYLGCGYMYLESVFVLPQHRKQGVAQRLRDIFESETKKLGYTKSLLCVTSDHPIVSRYSRQGYTIVKIIQDAGKECYLMVKAL